MKVSYQDRLLADQEQVKRRAHRHVLFVVLHTMPLVLAGILLWAIAGFVLSRVDTYPGIIAAILLVLSLIPLGIATYRFLWWRAEEYIVTNLRIIQCEGILSKRSLDSSLGNINDVEMKQSMFGRMFDFGDINILTASDMSVNDLHGIDQPFHFKRALLQAKAEFDGVWPESQPAPAFAAQVATGSSASGGNNQRMRQPAQRHEMDDTARLDNTERVLTALSELRNAGVLTEAEYQEKLQRLMNG
jgi:uncharacterized membrane protein YdbT with pleckstrin-like domain